MAKVNKSKISIKVTKINDNGQKEIKNKTFSKNNKKFKKEVEESKVLLEDANAFSYIQDTTNNENIQRNKDKEEYKELIKDIEYTNSFLFDSKTYFKKSGKEIKHIFYMFKYFFLGIYYYFRHLFSKISKKN